MSFIVQVPPLGHCIVVHSSADNLYISNSLIDNALNVGAYWAKSIGSWEMFDFVDAGNGINGTKSLSNGYYMSTNLRYKDLPPLQ